MTEGQTLTLSLQLHTHHFRSKLQFFPDDIENVQNIRNWIYFIVPQTKKKTYDFKPLIK